MSPETRGCTETRLRCSLLRYCNWVEIESIEQLCRLFNCNVGDLFEYLPDSAPKKASGHGDEKPQTIASLSAKDTVSKLAVAPKRQDDSKNGLRKLLLISVNVTKRQTKSERVWETPYGHGLGTYFLSRRQHAVCAVER
jgi:hypothetical protein